MADSSTTARHSWMPSNFGEPLAEDQRGDGVHDVVGLGLRPERVQVVRQRDVVQRVRQEPLLVLRTARFGCAR
jgi:hypothetical protein